MCTNKCHFVPNIFFQSAPKKGRRAGLGGFSFSLSPKDDEKDTADEVDSLATSRDSLAPSAPPRARKTGGWADESLKSGK